MAGDSTLWNVLTSHAISAVFSYCVAVMIHHHRDPNRGASKKSVKPKKDVAKRLWRPPIQTNSYEDVIACDVINPNDIRVNLDSIGGLEKIKQSLHELVILPLRRPELFSYGELLSPQKGVLLYGPPGTGKTMLAKALAKESGAVFINVTLSNITSKWFGESTKLVSAVFSLAHKLQPAIIFIDEVDSFLGKRRSSEHETFTSMKTEFMALWDGFTTDQNARVMVLAATNRPSELDEAILRRLPQAFEIGLPDLRGRVEILKIFLEGERVENSIDFDHIAGLCDGYSGSDLHELCKQAAYFPIRDLLDDENSGLQCSEPRLLSQSDLEKVLATKRRTKDAASEFNKLDPKSEAYKKALQAKKEIARHDANQEVYNKTLEAKMEIVKCLGRPLIQTNPYEDVIAWDVINPNHIEVGFDSIGGLESIKQSLHELVILPLRKLEGLGPQKGVLLYGPPGTGKTMLAKAIAKESSAVLINIRIANLTSMWFGETQKLVSAVFSLAHKLQPAIIFIDEVDTFLGKHHNAEHNNMKTEFMALWDGFTTDQNARVMVLAATNRPSELDEAILRRLPQAFEIGLPDHRGRVDILKVILKGQKVDTSIDLDHIAGLCDGYSGSDLHELCEQAAYFPIRELLTAKKCTLVSSEPRPLSQTDLEKVLATKIRTKFAASV